MTTQLVTRPATANAAEDEFGIEGALAGARRLAVRAQALNGIDLVDLPPIVGSAEEQARLRAVAPLYLVAELEATELIAAAEALAGIAVSGGLQGDLGDSASSLVQFWHRRNQRFTAHERMAIFRHLFGTATRRPIALATAAGPVDNVQFEQMILDVVERIVDYAPSPTADVSLQAAAARLAGNLLATGGGVPGEATEDLLRDVHDAVAIFRRSEVQAALGAGSLWAAVLTASRRYLHRDADPAPHIARGKSGMQIVSWLADNLRAIGTPSAALGVTDELRAAAAMWVQATLMIVDRPADNTTH